MMSRLPSGFTIISLTFTVSRCGERKKKKTHAHTNAHKENETNRRLEENSFHRAEHNKQGIMKERFGSRDK